MCPMKSCVAGPSVFVSAAFCITAASHAFWVWSHETSCTHQAPSCLRTFAHSIPSVGSTLPVSVHSAGSDPRPPTFRESLMSPCGRYSKRLATDLYGCVFSSCLVRQAQSGGGCPRASCCSPPHSARCKAGAQNRVVEPRTWTSARGLCKRRPLQPFAKLPFCFSDTELLMYFGDESCVSCFICSYFLPC